MNLRRYLCIFASALGVGLSLSAQTPAPPPTTPQPAPVAKPPTPAPAVAPPVAKPGPTPKLEEPKKEIVRERERTIYVPYEELEKVFSDGGKGVFLPYKQFLDLWNELTLKRQAEEVKPPQDGVVSRAEYTGHVEGETMIIDAKITVESFKKGWLTVPLAKGGAVPGIAEAETGKAILWAKPDGYDVILPDKGSYELKLKIYAPITKSAGKQSLALVLPQAAVSRFTATVPGSGWEFKVEPAAAFTSRGAGADTELSFFFGSGTKFNVTWAKAEGATELTPLVLASASAVAEVHAGSLATNVSETLRILRAPVKSFSFLIPKEQTVQAVTGADVMDWKIEPAGDKQKLTITPNAPVKDLWTVNLALESALPKLPTEAVVPEIIVEGAAQDRGDISISADAQLDVTPKPGAGMVQQTQTVAAAKGLSAVGGYRFLKHPALLALGIAEAKPQVDVDSLTVLTVKRDSSRVEATFNYNIRRVGIFEARVALPAGWTGWEVDGMPPDAWSVEKAGAGEMLVVKFNKQTLGRTSFAIRAQQQRATPTEDAVVPIFAPQGVLRYDAKIGVGVHSSLEVNTKTNGDLRPDDVNAIGSTLQLGAGNTYSGATLINAGALITLKAGTDGLPYGKPVPGRRGFVYSPYEEKAGMIDVSQYSPGAKVRDPYTNNLFLVPGVNTESSAPSGPADTELTLAFRHRGEAKTPATLSFKARDPQVNVEVLTLMEAKEQSLHHAWTLAFDVAYAATDRFVLAVPKSVAGDIRFADASVKEIHKNFAADDKLKKSLPDAATFDFWEVVLRNERMGAFQLSLSVEKPLAAAKESKLELLSVHVPGAFQETGQVAVVKDDNLEIRDSKAENLDEIDPKELRGELQRGGVFLAYKYKTPPLKLALNVVRNAYIEVPQAIVTQCLLTTAVSTDRVQTTEVIYWVKNNAQQFLTVQLPKGATLLSDIFVNGATQQPMKREGSSDVLIRLPTGGSVQQRNFPVRFVYGIPSPNAGEKLGWHGTFDIEPPLLDKVEVLEAHHQLYLPEGYLYTKFDGPMTQSVDDRGWRRIRGMTRLKNIADALIPAFGPQVESPAEAWHPIMGLPEQQRAGLTFNVPHQGQSVKLHRLGAPATVHVGFRSRKVGYVYEGIAFFIIMLWGLARWRRPLSCKVSWLAAVGLLAIIASGLLNAADGRIAHTVLLALACVVALWCLLGVLSFFKLIGSRLKPAPASSAASAASPASVPARTESPLRSLIAPPVPAVEKTVPPPQFPPSAAFSVWTENEEAAAAPPPSGLEFPRLDTPGDEPSSK